MSKSSEKLPRFEQAIDELERIIDQIESGQIDLEQSLACYERGMKLLGHCQTVLNTAQKRIAELSPDARGQLQVKEMGEPPTLEVPGLPGGSGVPEEVTAEEDQDEDR